MAAELTHGAVAALVSGLGEVPAPVLQVVGAPGPAPAGTVVFVGEYGLVLSDGVHSVKAALAVSMNGLIMGGLLRTGSVVRVLDYFCSNPSNPRVLIVSQVNVLQTECRLIGSPALYEINDAAQPKTGSYSDMMGICRPRMVSKIQQGVSKIARSRDQGLAGSSRAARAEHAVNNLREFYGLVAAQNTIDAKMQQLSYSNQGKRLAVPPTGREGFNTYRTIAQIKDESFRMSSQPDLITVVAAISHVDCDSFCYPACALTFDGKKCNNKLKVDGDGWWCTRCLWRSGTCKYRYMLKCQISDHTGATNATVMQDAAKEIIGHTAQELLAIKDDAGKDGPRFEEIMQGILCPQYLLKLRVKGHGVMMKRIIVEAEKLESPGRVRLLGAIRNLLNGTSNNSYGSMRSTMGASYRCPTDRLPRISTPPSAYGSMMTTGGRHTADQLPQMSTPLSAYGSMMGTGDASYWQRAGYLPQVPDPLLGTRMMEEELKFQMIQAQKGLARR